MQNSSLAQVDRTEAYWLPETSPGAGRLVVVAHGKKPTPCHRIDIVPVRTDSPTFAVSWMQEGEFCITKEVPYSFSEAFAISPRPDEIMLLCASADGKTEERRVAVGRFESNSLRLLGREHPLGIGSTPYSSRAPNPIPFAGPSSDFPIRPGAAPNSAGKFPGQVTFWSALYGQCEIWVDHGVKRWILRGQGGAFPGGGAFSGDIYPTLGIDTLIRDTSTCQIVSALFYVNVTFWDANSTYLGMMHGGGAGAGGGLFAGHWS